MKIVKYKKLDNNRYEVFLENGEVVVLFDDVIVKYNLLVNKELSEGILEVNEGMMAYYEGIKYIEKKLRTEGELRKYLGKKYKKEFVDLSVEKLMSEGYLSSKVYIECFVNDQINLTLNGPLKIREKLVGLGFDEGEVDEYLSKISRDIWDEKLEKVIGKKVRRNHKQSENKFKEKLVYDMVNLGYEKELVVRKVGVLEVDDSEALGREYNKLVGKLSKKYEGKELEMQLINKLMSRGFSYGDVKDILKDTNFCD